MVKKKLVSWYTKIQSMKKLDFFAKEFSSQEKQAWLLKPPSLE